MEIKTESKRARKNSASPSRWAWIMACAGSMMVIAYAGAAAFTTQLDSGWTYVLATGVLLLTGWLFMERQSIQRSAGGKAGKRTFGSIGLSAMALAVFAAVNMLGTKFDGQLDLTEEKRHTLSEQSQSVLAALDSEIKITAFFTEEARQSQLDFKALTDNMVLTSKNISVEIIDPIKNNLVASQYLPLSPYGTVFLEKNEDRQKIEGDFSEEKMIGSLIQFVSGKKHVICFTAGHGEMKPNDYENQAGMGMFVNAMLGQNYTDKVISLAAEQGVPDACEVVVVAGPTEDFLSFELEMLSAHVKTGKHLIVALESVLAKDAVGNWTNQTTPKLADHMRHFGISVGNDVVVELSPSYQIPGLDESAFFMVQDAYAKHPIITAQSRLTAFFGAREVKRSEKAAGVSVVELLKTSPDSRAGGLVELQSQLGKPGPISVVAAAEIIDPELIVVGSRQLRLDKPTDVENPPSNSPLSKTSQTKGEEDDNADITPAAGGKVLVSGAKSLFSNAWTGSPQFQNLDIGLNTIAWMVDETTQIEARTPSDKRDKAIAMTAYQAMLLWLACLILAPGLVLMGAIGTWRKRRSK